MEPIALVDGDIQVVSSWVSFAGLWISRNWSVHWHCCVWACRVIPNCPLRVCGLCGDGSFFTPVISNVCLPSFFPSFLVYLEINKFNWLSQRSDSWFHWFYLTFFCFFYFSDLGFTFVISFLLAALHFLCSYFPSLLRRKLRSLRSSFFFSNISTNAINFPSKLQLQSTSDFDI